MAPASYNPTALPGNIILGIFTLASTFFIGLRIWSRSLNKTRLQPSDYWLFFALICCYGDYGCQLWASMYGEGRVPMKLTANDMIEFAKDYIVGRLFWLFSVVAVRVSMTLLYKQIFTIYRFKVACWTNMALNACFVIVMVLVTFLSVRPFRFNWDHTIKGKNYINQTAFSTWHAVFNFILDLITIIMPLPVLWGLQMPTQRKWKLTVLFTAGLTISAISLTRTVMLSGGTVRDDGSSSYTIGILTLLEPLLGIITACLPFMMPISERLGTSFRSMLGRSTRSRTQPTDPSANSPSNNSIGSATVRNHPFKRIDDVEMNSVSAMGKPSPDASSEDTDVESGYKYGHQGEVNPFDHRVTRTREVRVEREQQEDEGEYPLASAGLPPGASVPMYARY